MKRLPGLDQYLCKGPSDGELQAFQEQIIFKTGVFRTVQGKGSVTAHVPQIFPVRLDFGRTMSSTLYFVTIVIEYQAKFGHLPPDITGVSSKLQASTSVVPDSSYTPRFTGTYRTTVATSSIITPSSKGLWQKRPANEDTRWLAEISLPLELPSIAGFQKRKGQKALLPTFSTCRITRTYEIEARVQFAFGGDCTIRFPVNLRLQLWSKRDEDVFQEAVDHFSQGGCPDYQG
jgi:hypothetical protein